VAGVRQADALVAARERENIRYRVIAACRQLKQRERSGQDLFDHAGGLLACELLVEAVVIVNELGEIET
jgi:hypothetical protein